MEAPVVESIIHGLEPIALIVRARYEEPGIRLKGNLSHFLLNRHTRFVD